MAIKHPRYLLFLAAFATAAAGLTAFLPLAEAVIAGFDLGVLIYTLSCVPLWRSSDAGVIRLHARRDDGGQLLLLFLSSLISIVVLVALSLLILDKNQLGAVHIALLIATLLSTWTFTNLIFAFHYARLYYSPRDRAHSESGDHEGLDFPGDAAPDFSDFVNFAFVIGMTCQTADITINKAAMRRVTTFHGLFAFAFNLGILALSVNVLAGSGQG